MKLKNQVSTLEQSEKLLSLGVCRNSQFFHKYLGISDNGAEWDVVCDENLKCYSDTENHIPAFTVAELGVMLPSELLSTEQLVKFLLLQFEKPWFENESYACHYIEVDYAYDRGSYIHSQLGSTEAEARAAMLIYLLENNLTTAAEVNERLAA